MPAVPKRFIITYLLAFALLCGGGFWATGRMLGAHWSRLPTEPLRRTQPFFETVHVLFFLPREGEELRLIAADDEEIVRIDGFVDGDDRYIAMIWMSHRQRFEVVAPFVYAKHSMVFPYGEFFTPDTVIPDADRKRAERLLYEKARTTFDMGHFTQSEIVFPVPIDDFSSARGAQISEGIETMIPVWLIPILFAFIPFLTAWIVTIATTRPNPNPA